MSACARASSLAALIALGAALPLGAAPEAVPGGGGKAGGGAASPPSRVVSINLCTDQLAMGLAAKGQLVSVSWLAADPRSSALAAEARGYRLNHAGAEEVYLMHPDLVLAGAYTAPATLALLRRLGLRVETFPTATSIAGAEANILRMGRALGREPEARAEVARMRVTLARLAPSPGTPRPTAALYYPNGYSPGRGTLADAVLAAAGFRNLAAETGRTGAGTLPLERLVMARPKVIVTSRPYPGASRAEAMLRHPALRVVEARAVVVTSGPGWACGTPALTGAVAEMAAARRKVVGQ